MGTWRPRHSGHASSGKLNCREAAGPEQESGCSSADCHYSPVASFISHLRGSHLPFSRPRVGDRLPMPTAPDRSTCTLRTKRAVRVGQFPGDNFAALRTIDDRWFHDHSLKTEPTGRMTRRRPARPTPAAFFFIHGGAHSAHPRSRISPALLPMLSGRFDLFNCSSSHIGLTRRETSREKHGSAIQLFDLEVESKLPSGRK